MLETTQVSFRGGVAEVWRCLTLSATLLSTRTEGTSENVDDCQRHGWVTASLKCYVLRDSTHVKPSYEWVKLLV